MKMFFCVISLVGLVSCSRYDTPNVAEQYQFQVQCKQATKSLLHDFEGEDPYYENHYNTKQNKCFAFISVARGNVVFIQLFDVNEHKELGRWNYNSKPNDSWAVYETYECVVADTSCQLKKGDWNDVHAAWLTAIKPYMTE